MVVESFIAIVVVLSCIVVAEEKRLTTRRAWD
jgi:hypothetical protein